MSLGQHKHKVVIVTLAVLAVGGGLLATRWFGSPRAKAAASEVRPEDHGNAHGNAVGQVHVKVIQPRPGGMERSTTQPCTVQAFEHEEIFAKISGYLHGQAVDIGSRVKKGQVLAEIDAPEYAKEVEQARAQVRQMAAHVDAAKAEQAAAATLVTQREVEVQRAQSMFNYRSKQYKRYQELVRLKSIDERTADEQFERYESAQAAIDAAKAAVEAAKADVHAKAAKVEQAKADLAAAQSAVAVAQAHLDKAQVFQGFTKIVSHYDGVITQRNFHNGDFIRQADKGGQTPLLTVQRTDLMRLVAQVPDTDVPFADVGDAVEFSIDNLPEETFGGFRLSRIAASEDEHSRTMRVEIDVPNPKRLLRDGMFGQVTIHLQTPLKSAMTLPASALVRDEKNPKKVGVYVIRDDKVHLVPVRVGLDNGAVAEVFSEKLSPDSQVVEGHSGPIVEGQDVVVEHLATAQRNGSH